MFFSVKCNTCDYLRNDVKDALWIGKDQIGKDGGIVQYDIEVREELEGFFSVIHHVKSDGHLGTFLKA